MKKVSSLLFLLFIILILAEACTSASEESKEEEKTEIKVEKKSLNPNGDSELAILMREMFEEAEQMKKQLANGEAIKMNVEHEKILTAHATEPKKASSPEFKAFAQMYLTAINTMKEAPPEEAVLVFDNLVSSCMSCHQVLCPGPMVRIKKLKQKV